IRKGFHREALRIHPDKNRNDIHADERFRELVKAYQILSNDSTRQAYNVKGDEVRDDTVNQSIPRLPASKRLSQSYERKIKEWINEFPECEFSDNFDNEIDTIRKNILDQYQEELNVKNTRAICFVCDQYCNNISEHMQTVQLDCSTHLKSITQSKSLNNILSLMAPDDWSWAPIKSMPSKLEEIWINSSWSSFEKFVQKLLPVADFLKNILILSSAHISNQAQYAEIEIIFKLTHHFHSVIKIPDLSSYTSLIDAELRTYKSGSDSNKTNYSVGQKISIVNNSKKYNVLSQLTYFVEEPRFDNYKSSKCLSCWKDFNLFRWRYSCRMCGKIYCDDCLIWQTCRHLGHTTPVRICHSCSTKIKSILINTIFEHIQQLLKENIDTEHLITYIHLLHWYRSSNIDDDYLYEQATFYYLKKKQYINAIQCTQYISKQNFQLWFNLAEKFYSSLAYEYIRICYDTISKSFKYVSNTWEQIVDDYYATGKGILALLAYEQAKLSLEDIWKKSISKKKINENDRRLFIFYVKLQKETLQLFNQWIKWLIDLIHDEHYQSLVIDTLRLIDLSIQDWSIILNDIFNRQQYMTLVSILCQLDLKFFKQIVLHDQCQNYFIKYVYDLFVTGKFECVEQSIERFTQHLNSPEILFGLTFVHALHEPNWENLREIYFSKAQFQEVFFCTKILTLLQSKSDINFDWIHNSLETNQSIFYLLKHLISIHSYKELAESYAKSQHFKISMNYYYLAFSYSSNLETVETILTSVTSHLSPSQALRCYISAYKLLQSNEKYAVKILTFIVDSFRKHGKSLINLSASIILNFQNTVESLVDIYINLLEELYENCDHNFILINDIHHTINNITPTTQLMSEKMKSLMFSYRKQLSIQNQQEIKKAICNDIITLTKCLLDVRNADILKKIHLEYFANRDISCTLNEYRAKMYIFECMISKLENHYLEATSKLNEAIVVFPSNEIIKAVTLIMNDLSFRQAILKDLLSDVELLSLNDVTTVSQPSMSFVNENFLSINTNLLLIRKYERGILKYLKNDPLQSAFSYIDMCQAVHDATCIVSNWTLACLYFFKLLMKSHFIMDNKAEVYAYRNLINELACQIYLFSSTYLSPHMQIYVFRLILPVLIQTAQIFRLSINSLCKANQIFRKNLQLILSEEQTEIINRLLISTINLSKVSPLIQIPVSMSYDILYRELVGGDFLVCFLENMIESNTTQRYLYEYYLFEGIWKGWARNKDFSVIRRACMKSLLSTKTWDMFDVQLLLDIPMIARTKDGWLCNDFRPLAFLSGKKFSHVDGIEFHKETGRVKFHFQPADESTEKKSIALFNTNDVIEVFKNNLEYGIFTLDQPDNEFHSHPFQQMRYHPSSLVYTQYLATLFHTDYLLKMFTTGAEICAKPPFDIQPINKGFFQRLPKYLQEKLKPINEYERNIAFGQAHRFWIEPDKLNYEIVQRETSTLFLVGDVRLRVRKHLLRRNHEGQLVDDENEDEYEKSSPESMFAKAFTDHYDEIGNYFPELLRLKELLKLSALCKFARAHYQKLSEAPHESIRDFIRFTRSQLHEYPHANDFSVEMYYKKLLLENHISSFNVPYAEANALRMEIRRQLQAVDQKIIEQLTDVFCQQAHTSAKINMKELINNWLDGSIFDEMALVNFIAKEIEHFHCEIRKPLEKLGIRLRNNNDEQQTL
ncbi:unnamed protein product, partial [Rotaria sp. Silwood2]